MDTSLVLHFCLWNNLFFHFLAITHDLGNILATYYNMSCLIRSHISLSSVGLILS